jgi:hypothetical protein
VDERRRSRIEIDSGQAVQCCQVKKINIYKIEDEKVGGLTSFFFEILIFFWTLLPFTNWVVVKKGELENN